MNEGIATLPRQPQSKMTTMPINIKKSKSADLGMLRRKHLLDNTQYASPDALSSSKFSEDDYIGRYSSWRADINLHRLIHATSEVKDCTDCRSLRDTNLDHELREDSVNMKIVDDRRTWNVGKVSVLMLILFSMTDLILNLVDAQMDSLVAPDHYDALSADVIRPAFRYHSSSSERISEKPRLGLGSAAIASVTTTFSPILPFTGGLDLRREDYWTNGWFGSVSSVVEQVRDAFSGPSATEEGPSFLDTPRGGGGVTEKSSKSKGRKSKSQHVSALSSSEPFVSFKDIADLTLKDVAMAFRYSIESTRTDFNGGKFMSGVVPRVKKVFEKMSAAAIKSGGQASKTQMTGVSLESGDIDALRFCAAMRIFAEWRVLRQVPVGYKGYAVGVGLGQKDIIQNVAKIEQAVHNFVDHRSEILRVSGSNTETYSDFFSPTLRDLLQFEIDMDVQDSTKLPRLKEKSAAMGLLWVRRQLHYQTALFANVIQVPGCFESAKDAVTAAYSEVYDKFHGWTVQKIFSYSFQAAPETTEVFKVMNPQRLKEVTEAAKSIAVGADTPKRHGRGTFSQHQGNPVNKLVRHIGREWDKLAGSAVQLFGQSARTKVQQVRGGGDAMDASQEALFEHYINKEMQKDAHEHILAYLSVAQPLLDDLANLFDEFNMDDPTKV